MYLDYIAQKGKGKMKNLRVFLIMIWRRHKGDNLRGNKEFDGMFYLVVLLIEHERGTSNHIT